MLLKKLLQTCKPDSVSRYKSGWLSFIWLLYYNNNLAAYPSRYSAKSRNVNEQFTSPLRRIGIYVALQHTRFTRNNCYQKFLWALTSHFHPWARMYRAR